MRRPVRRAGPGVYLAGDGLGGPATVVEGIADALRAAQAVTGGTLVRDFEPETDEDTIYGRKGNLSDMKEDKEESEKMPRMLRYLRELCGSMSEPGEYFHPRVWHGKTSDHPRGLYV